jgi:hypothetical protein
MAVFEVVERDREIARSAALSRIDAGDQLGLSRRARWSRKTNASTLTRRKR